MNDTEDNPVKDNELTDADILDAMHRIPGYLDISMGDFRTIYHLAHRHAQERLFAGVTAHQLMRHNIEPLAASMTLTQAVRHLADSGYKGLPVVDEHSYVTGILTETDFMKYLKSKSFMELLLKLLDHSFEFSHLCHETTVGMAMTTPVITVESTAGYKEIMQALHQHGGHSMPVISSAGKLQGILLRRDFLAALK
jgi:CBS-domain-containing membrane protein